MSKAYQSNEFDHNVHLEGSSTGSARRKSVQQVTGSGTGRLRAVEAQAATQPVTYRTRVYKIHSKALPEGEFVYTVIRDTSEHRVETNLPTGDLVCEAEEASLEAVRLKIDEFRKGLGQVTITDWRNFGSI
jgi:hypothetical protein